MTAIKRVWDGPFATPPAQFPISVGWVLLKFLETVWRSLLLLFGLAGLLAGYIYVEPRLNPPLKDRLKLTIRGRSPSCQDSQWPMQLVLANRSHKTLGRFAVEFRAYSKGTSENLIEPYEPYEFSDIVRPGYQISYCLRPPRLSKWAAGPVIVTGEVSWASEVDRDVPIGRVEPPPPVFVPAPPAR